MDAKLIAQNPDGSFATLKDTFEVLVSIDRMNDIMLKEHDRLRKIHDAKNGPHVCMECNVLIPPLYQPSLTATSTEDNMVFVCKPTVYCNDCIKMMILRAVETLKEAKAL